MTNSELIEYILSKAKYYADNIKKYRNDDGIYEIEYLGNKYNLKSVTTILKEILLDETINEYKDFKNEVGDEQFNLITQNAINRGNVMHKYFEEYAIGLQKNNFDSDNALLYAQQSVKSYKFSDTINEKLINNGLRLFYNLYLNVIKDDMKVPLLVESFLFSLDYNYAGTCDILYIDKNGKLTLGDYKTASGLIKKDSLKFHKYKFQIAAYKYAFKELYDIDIDNASIFISTINGCQRIDLYQHEYDVYLKNFLKNIKTT